MGTSPRLDVVLSYKSGASLYIYTERDMSSKYSVYRKVQNQVFETHIRGKVVRHCIHGYIVEPHVQKLAVTLLVELYPGTVPVPVVAVQ